MQPAPSENHFLDHLFAAIDRQDVDGFVAYLTEDAIFRFGSAPEVRGRQAIGAAVAEFFQSIDSSRHSIAHVWRDQQSLVCEGDVCYRRHDGTEVTIPFADVFHFRGNFIATYRIYIDIGPLFATAPD